MPQISSFFGIVISMFWDEHSPPHFHARYGEHTCCIDIRTFSVIEGGLPPRVLGLVIEWATSRQNELSENWRRVERREPLDKIPPLQ